MKKVYYTRWVLKLQHANQIDFCEELLEIGNQDPTGFFDRIVTEDETWAHHYDLLSQKEAKTWKKPGEKTPTQPQVT